MPYHPSVGEEVLIERARDPDCFKARVTSVSGKVGDLPYDVTVGFERLNGVQEENPTCHLSDIIWSFDPEKEVDFREFLSRLYALDDAVEAAEIDCILDLDLDRPIDAGFDEE